MIRICINLTISHFQFSFFIDFSNLTPPESCGFDLSTGEDKFCCAHVDKDPVLESQPPLFKDKNGKAYPCMDQTSHCEKWVQKFPENCEPNYDTYGFSENRYPFMREVCQESCHKRSGNFRGNKCEKVIKMF